MKIQLVSYVYHHLHKRVNGECFRHHDASDLYHEFLSERANLPTKLPLTYSNDAQRM